MRAAGETDTETPGAEGPGRGREQYRLRGEGQMGRWAGRPL